MVRLLFNRKNKTLRSVLCTKAVLSMLTKNYVTHCSLNNVVSVHARHDTQPELTLQCWCSPSLILCQT